MRTKLTNFNDGVLHYGTIKTKRNELKEKIGFDMDEAGYLFFNFRQIRQEDQDVYGVGKDQTSDLKVETYYREGIDKQLHKAVINGEYYEIKYIDPSNDRRTMFWYLTKKGQLNDIH